jgi:hypothetical protein
MMNETNVLKASKSCYAISPIQVNVITLNFPDPIHLTILIL